MNRVERYFELQERIEVLEKVVEAVLFGQAVHAADPGWTLPMSESGVSALQGEAHVMSVNEAGNDRARRINAAAIAFLRRSRP